MTLNRQRKRYVNRVFDDSSTLLSGANICQSHDQNSLPRVIPSRLVPLSDRINGPVRIQVSACFSAEEAFHEYQRVDFPQSPG